MGGRILWLVTRLTQRPLEEGQVVRGRTGERNEDGNKARRDKMLGLALSLAMFCCMKSAILQCPSDPPRKTRSHGPPVSQSRMGSKPLHPLAIGSWAIMPVSVAEEQWRPDDIPSCFVADYHKVRVEKFHTRQDPIILGSRLPY